MPLIDTMLIAETSFQMVNTGMPATFPPTTINANNSYHGGRLKLNTSWK